MRIASVPYLNARPLVEWFERYPQPGITLHYATPSVLVEQLLSGEVDIAMASTFPTLQHPELHLLPGLGITVTGVALSVRMLSRVPAAEIRSLALDTSSRSSVVLARIILADRYQCVPVIQACRPALDEMLARADAGVLIGDIGLAVPGDGLFDLDLGQEWWELTGKPFYFAGWIARDPARLAAAAPLLFEACDYGLAHLPEIATSEAQRLQISYETCYRYLTEVMRYRTGDAESAGLAEFHARARRLGVL